MTHCFSKMILLGAIAAWQLSAVGIIVQDVTGTTAAIGSAFYGVNFLTPAGGPWNNLTFNFYAGSDATTPTAAGTLYLLSSNYTGAPNALGSASGIIASTSTVSGGVWDFAPSVTVAAGTQYYVFEDTALMISGAGTGLEATYYSAAAGEFFGALGVPINFNLSGNVVSSSGTPEPTTLLLMAPALLLVLRRRLTK